MVIRIMKGNLISIIGWLAYNSRVANIPRIGEERKSYCFHMTQVTKWHCSAIVDCNNCPFIRYSKSYLENY